MTSKRTLITAGALALLAVVVAVVVVGGGRADRVSALECRSDQPRRGEWSQTAMGSDGLRVFRSTCAECHGFTDDGAWCLRPDGDALRGPVAELTEATRHDAATIRDIIRSHRLVADAGASLLSSMKDADLNAVSALVAEIR